MKYIEIIIVDKGKITKSFTIQYSEQRRTKLNYLDDMIEMSEDEDTLHLLYRYNKNYNMLLWRTYLRGWIQEDMAKRYING